MLRRLYLQVLGEYGGGEELLVVRAYAENPMVAEDMRKEAARVAEQMERRR